MIDFNEQKLGDQEDILVIELFGHLDTMHCDYLYSVLEHRITDGWTKLILDCNDLKLISSMGLGMLMRVHSKMKKQGGIVRLARLQGPVATVIHLVMLDKVLNVYGTVEQAVDSFA